MPSFASGVASAYLGPMRILPRPASPRSALSDLKLFLSSERPHRWGLLGLSAALTFLILWAFWVDSRAPDPGRQIFYVESWMSDRKDSDIIKQQQIDLVNYEAALVKKQKQFQKVADMAGIDWRKDEAENRARRQAINTAVAKYLDKRLAEALAREAAEGKAPQAPGAAAKTP